MLVESEKGSSRVVANRARERLTGPTGLNAVHLRKGQIEFHTDAREICEWRKRAFEAQFLHELASGLTDNSVGEEVSSRLSRKKQS